jgi:hypothetical protein
MANTIDFNVNTNAVTVLNQIDTAAENTAQGFSSAKAELRALNQQLLQMDSSSEEFKKASARAAELKDNIGDLSAEINANAGNAFEGLSNNIGLFSSRLMSLDLKGAGQSLSAMGNAVSRIDFNTLKDEVGGLVKGLGNLAGAIVGNPLLALGGAVALLVLNFDKINAALSGTAEKVEKLGEANVALEKQNQILDARITKEKTLNGESFKTLELEKEKALNNVQVAENELAIAKTTGDINLIREKENKLIETRNLLSGITAKGEADRAKLVEEAKNLTIAGYKEEQERRNAVAKFEDARQQQLAVIAEKQRLIKANLQKEELIGTEQQYTTERANFVEKDIETKKVLVQSERQKQLQAELNQLVEEEKILRDAKLAITTGTTVNELKKAEAELQKELNKDKKEEVKIEEEKAVLVDNSAEEFRAAYKAISDAAAEQAKQNELRLLSEKDREIQINKEKYDALIAEADLRGIDTTVFLEAQLSAEAEIKKKYADKELEDAKKLAEDKLAAEQALVDAKFTLASASVNLLGTLFAKNKKAADIAFALDKALAIAGVVVNTQREISSYNSNPLWSAAPDGGASIKIPAILAAKIRAAASIATIAGTTIGKFMNGGNATVGGSAGGTSGGGTTAPSPANFAFLQNQPNQQPPLQAYVVSTQVSSNLEAQQLINNQARLGG